MATYNTAHFRNLARQCEEYGYMYLYLYQDREVDMIACYRHISGLVMDEDGKYIVVSEDGRSMGKIIGEAIIKESW